MIAAVVKNEIGLGRILALGALAVINIMLIAGIMKNHEVFPFGGETVAGPSPDVGDQTLDDGQAGVTAPDGGSSVPTEVPATSGTDQDGAATGGGELEVDDWPGGHGPVPDGSPVDRHALFDGTGQLVLTGSVPSWAVATEIVEVAGSKLPNGTASVVNQLTWHPEASPRLEAGTVRLDPAVLYPIGATDVPAEATEGLDRVAQILIANPTVFIVVIGYTDDLGGTEDNAALAFARGTGVVEYLAGQGANPAQMVIAAAGEDQPAASNETEEGRRINRRIEIQYENFLNRSLSVG